MKLITDKSKKISSSQCWKLAAIHNLSPRLRWHIGRQYHFDLGAYNHPFWVHLQKKVLWWWKDVGEVSEPFYPRESDMTHHGFIQRVIKTLGQNPQLIENV